MDLRKLTIRLQVANGADGLEDSIAVGAVFNIVTRYTLRQRPRLCAPNESERAAGRLLKRGYAP